MLATIAGIAGSAAAKKILPILVEAGAGLLVDVVRSESPQAGAIVEKIAAKLGVQPTPEAIAERYAETPEATKSAARAVESENPEMWTHLAAAQVRQAELLKRDDESERFLSWAWRPTLSWLLIVMWAWNAFLAPVLMSTVLPRLAMIPWEQLLAFSGIWLTIYGGGHTLKSVMGHK